MAEHTITAEQEVTMAARSQTDSLEKGSLSPAKAMKSKSRLTLTAPHPSKSTKSTSDSEPPVKAVPRRSRLFRGRVVSCRPAEPDDLKYLYASWRLGKLHFVGFELAGGADPDAFSEAFNAYTSVRFRFAYTMLAKPPGRDVMPVGIVFGLAPVVGQPLLWLGDFTWFPWASTRNKLESVVNLFNQLRRELTLIGFADDTSVNFFEHACKYGVLRRVGKVYDMLDSGVAHLFQSRKPYLRTG